MKSRRRRAKDPGKPLAEPQRSHGAEKTEAEYRFEQLQEVEAGLTQIKSSLETLRTLAEAQTKAIENQCAIVHLMREAAQKNVGREVSFPYGRMWT